MFFRVDVGGVVVSVVIHGVAVVVATNDVVSSVGVVGTVVGVDMDCGVVDDR